MQADAPRILVIRLSSMGDVILTTPALAALKRRYPRAQIDVAVKQRYGELLQGHPHVDGLFLLSPDGGLPSLWRRLRQLDHQIIVDLHANLRSRLLTAILPAAIKLRYRKRVLQRWAMVHGGARPSKAPHVVDQYLDCLRPLGIDAPRDRPHLYLSEADREFLDDFILNHRLRSSELLVGLHPGARWTGKRWSQERYVRLGHRLREELKAQLMVFGGAGEDALAALVAANIGSVAVPVTGFSLRQLMALISGCDLFITNDSGPMHMATALGVPVVAVFGPTHPMLGFWPLGEQDVFLTAGLSCSPCSLHGERRCPRGNWSCLEEIRVQDVFTAVQGVLKSQGSAIIQEKPSP